MSRIETSSSDDLISYLEQSLEGGWGFYPSAEMQSVYSTATSDLAQFNGLKLFSIMLIIQFNINRSFTHSWMVQV